MQFVLQPVLYYIRLYIANLVSAHCSLFNTSFRISLTIHLYSADNKYKWYECIVINFVVINRNTFMKKIFSIYFTNTVSHLKGEGGSQKKNRFFGQIFAVQKLYVERFNFQCAHLLVLGIFKKNIIFI